MCTLVFLQELSVWSHLKCFDVNQLAKDDVPSRNTQLRAAAVCEGQTLG